MKNLTCQNPEQNFAAQELIKLTNNVAQLIIYSYEVYTIRITNKDLK